jgi:hypothetical protein
MVTEQFYQQEFLLHFDVGNVTIGAEVNSGWSGGYWGQTGWGAYGDVLLSGISLSANLNSVSINAEVNIGWGSDTWGYETWGTSGLNVPLTGVSATFDIGTLGVSADASTGELTGQAINNSHKVMKKHMLDFTSNSNWLPASNDTSILKKLLLMQLVLD